MQSISKEIIADQIAIKVIESCGYPIGLVGEKGIEDFKYYYLSEKNS